VDKGAARPFLARRRKSASLGVAGTDHYDSAAPDQNLDDIAEAYAAMDERRAIKSLVRVGDVRTR
jgi:hypothetical protein